MTLTTTAGATDVRVTVARTPEEVRRLRRVWESLDPADLDADIDHFLTVVEHDPATLAPNVLLLERRGTGPVLVVARLARHPLPIRMGYRTLATLHTRALVVSFDGVVGSRSERDRTLAVAALRAELDAGVADVVLHQKVEKDSPLMATLVGQVPRRLRSSGPPVLRWRLDVPDSFEEMLARRSSKSRQRIRHERLVWRRDFPDRCRVARLERPEHHHRLEPDIEQVSQRRYQHALGIGKGREELDRALRRTAAALGRLRAWMLYVDDEPVAYWWGQLVGGVLFSGDTGYDPDYAHKGAGYFTMLQMFEDCCEDADVRHIDFGHGDAPYKQRFATSSTVCQDVHVFSSRLRPQAKRAVVAGVTWTLALPVLMAARSRTVERLTASAKSSRRRKAGGR